MSEESESHDEKKVSRCRPSAPLLGCLSGGCLLPTLLFLVCAAMGNTGALIIWPITVVVFGCIGLHIGVEIRNSSNHKR